MITIRRSYLASGAALLLPGGILFVCHSCTDTEVAALVAWAKSLLR